MFSSPGKAQKQKRLCSSVPQREVLCLSGTGGSRAMCHDEAISNENAISRPTCYLGMDACPCIAQVQCAVAQFKYQLSTTFPQITKGRPFPPVRIWSIVERGSKFNSPFGRHSASTSTPIRARWDGHALKNNTDDDDGLTLYMYELCKRLSLTSRLELEG